MNRRTPSHSWLRVTSLAVIAAVVFGLFGFAGAPGSATSVSLAYAAKVDKGVMEALASSPDGKAAVFAVLGEQADLSAANAIDDWDARGWAVYNALSSAAERTQPAVMATLRGFEARGQASEIKSFWIVNLISLHADEATIRALAAMPQVERILPHVKLEIPQPVLEETTAADPEAVEWGVAKIRANEVWSTYGVTGAGAVAANVDTGVQYNHPALVNQYRGNLGGGVFDHNYNWFNPAPNATCPNPNVPCDDNGHGSHTMGTEIGDDGGANQIGVAPGADWIAAYGCCPSNEALLEAQQWMVAPTDLAGNNPDPSKRPHVLNQSWGGPGGSQIFEGVIASLRASGIFPAFSAGNNGAAAADGCGRLGSPGDNPSAFNVGNTTSTDAISSSSSRGPNPFTGKIGPEVSAPGSNVRSSVPTNSYANFSGTSMASPHVAGSVALLISLEPKLAGQIEQLEELLRKTAVPLTSAQTCGGVPGSQIPNNVFGWGRIDVKAAADMVYQAGAIQGTVTVGGTPTAGVTVTFSKLGKTLTTTTDASGFYKVIAGSGSWDMSASIYGQTVNAAGVAVVQNGVTVQNFAIPAITFYTVSGVVSEASSGVGVPAMLMVANQDVMAPVWASAVEAPGAYSIMLPAGTWDLLVSHPGYQTATQNVVVAGNMTQNIFLTPRFNYACVDNTQAGGPTYNWIDVTDGTAFPLDDDASSAAITLPGTFTYFGTDYTTVRINSNGFIYFGTTTYSTAHMVLPFEGRPNTDAMAFGEDLNPALGTQGTIYGKAVGSQYIIQYHQVQHWASGFPETFQIILDTTTDTITYQYNTLSWPDFTSVGVENATGTVGQMYSYRNSANLAAGRAVQFTPGTGTAVNWGCDHALSITISDTTDPVEQGNTITYMIHWNSIGFGGAPNAQLTATVPGNTSFVSASGGVTPAGGVLTWNLGNQRPGAEGTAWFTVTANSGTQATASATISDSSGESRSASETTAIQTPLAVGLADFSAAQGGSSSVLLLGVIAMALLALATGFAWQKRTA
ncbi:MAG: S8 family serine peptidase [Anaerolineae bacterium]